MSVRIFKGPDALAEGAAATIASLIENKAGKFHLALSGGSTPKLLYQILASDLYRESVDWSRVHLWLGDERWVPATDGQSNEKMMRETLADHVPATFHSLYRGDSPEADALSYEEELKSELAGGAIDLVLLGIGPDGHTASLFPGDPSVNETQRWVVPSVGAAGVSQRLTLTPPLLRQALSILFLVAGSDKAEPLKAILEGPFEPNHYPAQVVSRNAANVQWYLDEAAASLL